MPDLTARLGLPILAPSQAQKHVTHNEALQRLDGAVQTALVSIDGQTPPLFPVAGDVHALGAAPTGVWSGQAGKLAQWQFGQWQFIAPQEGWRAWDLTDGLMRIYSGGGWGELLQNVAGLGLGTTSDAQNLLAVASPASLFSHAGAGHQLKINKAAAGDSATLLYQSNWIGHAEMGLAGDNDFHIKTSADGSIWTEALVIEATSGTLSGAAVQTDAVDTTPGRLMPVGAFGLGNVTGTIPMLADIDAVAIPEGTWGCDPTTIGTFPPPLVGAYGIVSVTRYNSGITRQIITRNNADSGMWWRTNNGASWEPWRRVIDSQNLLGTVSQSAGIPTGAVIESGSNANGEYIRFADGTQICWSPTLGFGAVTTVSGSGYRSGDATFTFPAVFVNSSKVMVSGQTSSTARWMALQLAGTTSVVARLLSFTSFAGSETGRILAIGRWY